MALLQLQHHLQQIYAVDIPHRVSDYLITDPELAAQLTGQSPEDAPLEQLLIQQEEDCLALSLYISREITERLAGCTFDQLLEEHYFADFCIALEGISHFVYLTWNATYNRTVSLLELELQAEVDKYITAITLPGCLAHHAASRDLRRQLFMAVGFAPQLNDADRHRYWLANHYADRYCQHLHERFLHPHRPERMMRELRHFYRLPRQEKMHRIDSVR